ncbi:MAG: phosphate acyltransferase PlsX [Chloroflexota bacterium]
MKIVLDAVGGDFAPAEAVKGAVEAARQHGLQIALVGPEATVRAELAEHDTAGLALEVVDAPQVVGMDEHPVAAVRQKRRSSLAVGLGLVRDGQAQAFVSAGNSGAVLAASLFVLGRIEGVDRPAICAIYPTLTGPLLLLDIGANADVRPQYLQQFALLGSVYMEKALGRANPRVALLSNGEEDTKGNLVVQEAHRLLRDSGLNFVGNVEGGDLPTGGKADVVVCDGFVGNVAIKLSEGLSESLFSLIREELSRGVVTKLAPAALRPAFRRVKRRLDYEEYGGAPLLGVKGVVIISHGRSRAKAIRNALRVAAQAAEQRLVETVAEGLAAVRVE